jgi:hypothetical protein
VQQAFDGFPDRVLEPQIAVAAAGRERDIAIVELDPSALEEDGSADSSSGLMDITSRVARRVAQRYPGALQLC